MPDDNIEAILAPQDLAELSETTDAILAHPMPSPEALERLRTLSEGSEARIQAMMDEPGDMIHFDTTTPQGHIDAVTYVQSVLLGAAAKVREAEDQIEANQLFEIMHQAWTLSAPSVQFNIILNLADALIGTLAVINEGKDD